MAYARVVNMEYKSIEDLEQAIKRWADISMQKTLGFPEALSRTVIEQVQHPALMLLFMKQRSVLRRRVNF